MCTCSILSPFRWSGDHRPSIFVRDSVLLAYQSGKAGRQEQKTLITPMRGLSAKGDRLLEQTEYARKGYRAAVSEKRR